MSDRFRRASTLVLLAAGLAVGQAAVKPPIPPSDAAKLRTAITDALADPARKRDALATQARALDAKYSLASLMEALRAGPKLPAGDPKPRSAGGRKEELKRLGEVLVGLTFTSGSDRFGYLVSIPKGYDPAKPAPVVLDPGHGSGAGKSQAEKADFVPYFRNAANAAGLGGALVVRTEIIEQIGADGQKGARPEDDVARVFDDCLRDVASRFAVDPDRIFVAGISQTGFWSWYLGRARPDRFAGIAPIAAVTWQVDRYLDAFALVPVYAVHGEKDPVCKVEQPRRTTQALKELGFPVTYVEIPGGEHGGPVFGRLGEALGALRNTPRDPWPKRVRRPILTTKAPHAYWVKVTKLETEGDGKAKSAPVATLDARVEGQAIVIGSRGITALELALSAELLDLARPITVTWNGKPVHDAVVTPSFAAAVEVAVEKADWRGAGPARLKLTAPR